MVSNFPLAQHRVTVSASAGLSLCTAHGATEQGKPLPARPRGRISPGETENTKLAGFYSRSLGSARYSEFLVHSPVLLSRKQLINKLFGQQLNSFYLAKRKATSSRDFIKQQPSIFTSPTQKKKPCSNDSLWQLSENGHSKFIRNVQKEQNQPAANLQLQLPTDSFR